MGADGALRGRLNRYGRSEIERVVTADSAQPTARVLDRIFASAAMIRSGQRGLEREAGRNGAKAAKRAASHARGLCWLLAAFGCLAAWGQPAAISSLSATVGDAQANLSWTAASGATGYQVRRGTGSPLAFNAWTTIASTTTATVSGLTNGTRYAFEVRAVSALGGGAAGRVWAALATSPSAAVTIPDAMLRRQVEIYSRQSAGDTITQLEMANMSTLGGSNIGISSLSGLEYALNLEELHLAGNSITDISALSGLLSMGNLILDRNSISDISPLSNLTSLTWLGLDQNNISDISALTNMTALRYLHLWQNQISDISALSGLTSLIALYLQNNSITDISALSNLTALGRLNLRYNTISNISSLSRMTSLTYLNLSRNNMISDISSLSGLRSLTWLNLFKNSITDISPLSNLTSLTWLALADNSVTDISTLSNLTALQTLYLPDNTISNISSLSGLRSLTTLDLSNNNSLSDISHLSMLTALTNLRLPGNMISDISHLSNLTSLRTLYLSDNSLSDISTLSGLTALVRLRLSNNSISDISHLSGLTSLTQLYLSGNQLSDISHLSGLTALSSLRLAENTIADISALVANAGLATGDSVDLRTNLLNVAAVQTHIPALQTRGVTVQFDPPSAAVSATNPMPLVEGSLNSATVTVTLNSTIFASGVSASSFTLTTNVPGLTIDSVATVASGATSATLTLAHTGANFDTNRTLSVTVAAAAHMLSGDLATASVTVAPEGGVTVDPTSLSLHENPAAGGATNANVGTYSVVLTGEPQGDVTVTATSADDAVTLAADVTPLTTALTFTTSTWSTAQTVTATARQDDDEADESVLVTHAVWGYGDVTTARSVTVAVDDDEPPTAAITSPAILTSSVLPIGTGNPTISLLLTGSTFVSGVGPSSFELVTGLTTISIASATATPGSAVATLTIGRSGATSWDKKFAVKVLASAHAGDTDITTPPIDAVLQDTAPSFQSATLPTRYVHRGEAIAPFQIPAASGGNDAIRYTATNLLDGLKFDATGTDANGCTAADFPAGTAAAWATAPRTVCGATTMIGGAQTIFHAHDSDSNEANSDRSSLQVDILVVRAILYDTNPSPLAEAGLNGATGNLQIYNAAFVSGATDASFELVTAIPGLSIASITPNPTTGRATFSLAFSGDFDTPQTLALKIKAAAHNRSFDIVTEALTVNPQPPADTAPTFGASTVPDQYVVLHEAMAPLQIPAASGGNGAISYVASAVRQQGIKFDATGTDADGCTAGDFPSGTDAVWATAPRTLCGTPTGFVSLGISIHAHDADSNRADADRDTLSVTMLGVSAAISTTTPSTLTEASLNSATIEVQLVNTTFSSGVAAASFELVTDIPDLTISQVSGGASGSATSTLTLAFTGDFGTPETLAVKVKAAAHNRSGDLTTNALTIDPQGLVDTAPTFGTATAPALYFRAGVAIAPVQLPAASGGNGALSYAVSGSQLFGLKFDATGTDAGGCTASDFPPGTISFWATAPRTLCGTPTGPGSSGTVILSVQDADSNRSPTDQSALSIGVNIYGASITSTTPSALTGTNLHDATVGVQLLNAAFATGVTAASFELVTDIPGVSISGLSGAAAASANATLTLAFTGDFVATSTTLAVKVPSAAHNRAGDLTTNAVTVAPADTEPVFPSVAAKSFLPNVAIAPFQIPAAVGGNGAVSYAIAGLPAGLKFDLTGTDAGGCTASDFPAGTAASWATEPRTICGTPTSDAESVVVFSATDEDGDVGRLMLRVTVAGPAAALGDTVPATLTEANLHGATVIVALARTSFASGVTKASFELITTIPGIEISSISTVAEGDTQATLTLAFTGDFSGARTIAVKVSAAAHRQAGDLTTGTLSVAATPLATIAATSPATLAESNLDGATLTVTLADTSFASGVTASSFTLTTDVPGLTIGSATTPPSGATSTTLTLAYTGANFDEARSLTVTVAAAAHALVGDLTTGAVTVAPTRGVTLSTSTLTVQENNSATYTVRLASRPTGGDVTVTITGAGSGITVSATSLTFTGTNWNTPQQVRVAAAEDGDSTHESVTLTHTPSGAGTDYAGVTPAELDVTAADNDTPGLGVDPQMLRIDEGTEATYAVRLNTDPGGSVTVTVAGATAAVTADTDSDRANGNQNTLTFNSSNWDTPQTVTVSVPEDDNDTDESATLTHAASGASTYTGLDASARPSVAVTVDDNDTPAVLIDTDPTTAEIDGGALAVTENQSVEYTVRLKTQPTGMVTVTATSAAPAVTLDEDTTPSTTALTFTTSTWATAQTVTATAQEDADSADELVSVTHTVTGYSTTTVPAVTVMVFDDDASITLTVDDDAVSEDDGATTITVTATLASATRFAKTVQVSVAGSGTATAVDFAEVSAFNITIAAGAASGTGTFTLTPTDDAVHEADETITVSGTSGTLTVDSATITLTDDQALPTVALALGPMSISENGGVSTVTATLSAASSAAVTLTVTAATGTNAVAADFSLSTAKTLTIAAGATTSTGTVTVTAVNNDVDAADKSVTVSAMAAGGNGVAAPSSVTLTLTDDDTAGITFSPTTLTVTEQGASQKFTMVLDSEPTGLVYVRFHPDPGISVNGAVAPDTYYWGSLDSSNWDTGITDRELTVAALADSNKQDETRYVKYSMSGYGSFDAPFSNPRNGVKVTVIDDDKPAVSLSLSPSSISENGGEATVTATLDAASTATTTITVTAATGTNAVSSDFKLSSAKTLAIAAGSTTSTGTVTIGAVDNALDEPDKSVTVSGTASNSDGVKQPADRTLTITDDDPAPMLSISSPSVSEGNSGSTSLTYTVTLSAASGREVTVEYEDARTGTATSGTDYTAIPGGTLTFAAGTTSQTFDVSVTGDVLDEADETVKVRLKDPVNAAVSTTAGTGTGTITDDDATPMLSISEPSVAEGDSGSTPLTYTVTLSAASGRQVTVQYADSGLGTATSGTDYTAITAGTLTFAAGTTSRTFSVSVTGDTVDEPNETVVVNWSNATNAVISSRSGVVSAALRVDGTITDDDGPPTSITLTVDDNDVGEGDGATTITVTATVDGTTRFAAATTVTVSVAGSGTTRAVNFDAVTDFNISIAAGAASGAGTFTLTPKDDLDDETDETITVSGTSSGLMVNPATISLTDDDGTPTSITLTVNDDSVGEGDGATTITVTATLNGTTALAATTTVSVSVAASGTASAVDFAAVSDFDIEIAAGAMSETETFTLTPTDDVVDETDETVTVSGTSDSLTVNSATITLTDDDATPTAITLTVSDSSVGEGDGATSITVTATVDGTTRFAEAKTVRVSVAGSGTAGAVDFAAVEAFDIEIAAEAASDTAGFTLTPTNDAVDETDETVTVSGASGSLTVNAATITLADDDAAPTSITLTVDDSSVGEGDGAATITVTATVDGTTRFAESTTVTVSVAGSGTATAVDFAAVSDFDITIPAGAASKTGSFTLTPTDDAEDETDETVTVSGTSGSLTVNAATIALTDDDAAPTAITLTVSDDSVSEGDGATTITVTATVDGTTRFAAATTVSVLVRSDSGTMNPVDFASVPGFDIEIAAGDASGTETFTLTPTNDAVDENDETITVYGASGSLTVSSATITLTDDDATPTAITLTVSDSSVAEDDGATTITVTATVDGGTRFATATTVTVSVAGTGTAGAVDFAAVSDFDIEIDASDASGTGTFTLTPTNDVLDETNETITVSGTSGSLTVSSATITLTDDDATPSITLTVDDSSVAEDDGATTITVTATVDGTSRFVDATTVTVSVAGSGTATAVDFAAVSDFDITIAAGAASANNTFTLTPTNDVLDETNETVTVSGESGSLTVNAATITLTDDDATPSITLTVDDNSVAEDDGATTITVTATVDGTTRFAGATTVTVSVAGSGTASAVDFAAVSDFDITIAAGAASANNTFTLTPTNDAVDETNETVTVSGESGSLTVNAATITLTDDDGAPTSITLTVNDNSVAEDDGATTITVTAAVDGPTRFGAARTVTVSVAGSGTATAVDFAAVADFDIMIAAGAASANNTFTLTPTNDMLDETDETVTVSGTSTSLTVNSATIDLTDDDATPSITLTVNDDSVAEDDGVTTITVTATVDGTTRFAESTTVSVSVSGSGTAGAVDFTAVANFDIMIAAEAASANNTFTLTPTDDTLDEADETITVSGTSGSLTVNSATITLADDDATPSLSIDSPIVAEGNAGAKDMTFTVTLSAASGRQVTVNYAVDSTDPGTATSGTDYAPVSAGTLTFAVGATSETVTVSVTGDTAMEPDETVRLALSGATNATLGAAIGVGTIVNEDGASLIAIDADPTTASVLEPGPLALQELLTDSDNSKSYSVRLKTPPTQDVTVTIASGDTDAVTVGDTDGVMPGVQGTLTFTGLNWSTARTVTLTAAQDDDGVDESVTVTHAASTASNSEYTGDSASLTATVADDETPALVLDAGPVALVEGHATDVAKTYSVRLATEPTQTVTVTLTSADTGAVSIDDTDGDNTNGVQSTLVFASTTWDTVQTVTARAADDHDAKDESVVLGAAASTATPSEYTNLAASLTATVDDDETRAVTLSTSTLSVQENGSATYTVRLGSQPVGGNVTVTITGAGGGIAASPTSLTFTGADWNTPQQVRVNAARDANSANETATLTHTPSGAGTDYAGAATAQIVVTATDIDPPGLQVSPAQLAVAEGASRTYTVRLNSDPEGTVTVTATSNDAAVTLDADSTPQERTLTFNASNWDMPQTVTASAVEDDNATDESVTVTHAASGVSAYTGAHRRGAAERAGGGGRQRRAGHRDRRGPEHAERHRRRPAGGDREPVGAVHGASGDAADRHGDGDGAQPGRGAGGGQRRQPAGTDADVHDEHLGHGADGDGAGA